MSTTRIRARTTRTDCAALQTETASWGVGATIDWLAEAHETGWRAVAAATVYMADLRLTTSKMDAVIT